MIFSKELLDYYRLATLDEYIQEFGKEGSFLFYSKFLEKTDYIPNKIFESQLLNETIDDYTSILNYRKYAREQINNMLAKEGEE